MASTKETWVYDTQGGGDYVKAAILSLGITDEQFIQNLAPRLSKKTQALTATIHKNKMQSFANEQICASAVTPKKVAQMERSGLATLVDLAEGSGMLQLESALERRVTEECLSL